MQKNVQITGKWSKSKPKVDIQYGGRLFFTNESNYISEVAAYRAALHALRPGPALSPLGTRLHSIAEVLPDAAPTGDHTVTR